MGWMGMDGDEKSLRYSSLVKVVSWVRGGGVSGGKEITHFAPFAMSLPFMIWQCGTNGSVGLHTSIAKRICSLLFCAWKNHLYQNEYQASELSYVSLSYAILAAWALQDISPFPEASLPLCYANIVIGNAYPSFKPKSLSIQNLSSQPHE